MQSTHGELTSRLFRKSIREYYILHFHDMPRYRWFLGSNRVCTLHFALCTLHLHFAATFFVDVTVYFFGVDQFQAFPKEIDCKVQTRSPPRNQHSDIDSATNNLACSISAQIAIEILLNKPLEFLFVTDVFIPQRC